LLSKKVPAMPPKSLSAAAWPFVAGAGKFNALNEHFPVVDPAVWAKAAVAVAAMKKAHMGRERAFLWLFIRRLILRVVLGGTFPIR
jgi:hypothetical protein